MRLSCPRQFARFAARCSHEIPRDGTDFCRVWTEYLGYSYEASGVEMKAEDIRNCTWIKGDAWFQEIAYQLAVMNEQNAPITETPLVDYLRRAGLYHVSDKTNA